MRIIDTVGAGDAVSAVLMLGNVRGWSPVHTLRRAVYFASKVCQIRGATNTDREFYQSFFPAGNADEPSRAA